MSETDGPHRWERVLDVAARIAAVVAAAAAVVALIVHLA
jgi:hypothetical protein